jgi:hypothetical protein
VFWKNGALRRRLLRVCSLKPLLVPVPTLDTLQLPLQFVVFVLFLPDLVDDGAAIALIMFPDKRWYEVDVLRCFLGGGQAGTGGLPLARALDFSIHRRDIPGSILSFPPDLLLQLM